MSIAEQVPPSSGLWSRPFASGFLAFLRCSGSRHVDRLQEGSARAMIPLVFFFGLLAGISVAGFILIYPEHRTERRKCK